MRLGQTEALKGTLERDLVGNAKKKKCKCQHLIGKVKKFLWEDVYYPHNLLLLISVNVQQLLCQCTCCYFKCVVPENIHTPTAEGHWKFLGGGGLKGQIFLKESIRLNWNFQRGGGFKPKITLCGGAWVFFWNNSIEKN